MRNGTSCCSRSWRRTGPALVLLLAAACGGEAARDPERAGRVLAVWAHRGKESEWRVLEQLLRAFDAGREDLAIELVPLAEASYDAQVQAAAATGRLPDVLELDGPMLASYAWKGYLRPLEEDRAEELFADLLPTLREQATWEGRRYAAGMFDSGLALYGDRAALRRVGARIPAGIDEAWTIDELDAILEALARREREAGGDGRVIDLKRSYRGEWWTYGFLPVLASAGADLVAREGTRLAHGMLDGEAAVRALSRLQRWFTSGLVDPNADDRAFQSRRVALSWVGHWEAPRYQEALGHDLLLLPLPDFGEGPRTSMGSWCFGITTACRDPAAAYDLLAWLVRPEHVLAMAEANGAVPAARAALERSPQYGPGGPLRLFAAQLERIAVSRPRTPAYPFITSVFQEAMLDILAGGDVRAELERAASMIDADFEDHQGYPVVELR